MNKYLHNRTGGFIGLIALLVVIAIIGILMAKNLHSSFAPVQTPTGTEENAIKAAEAAKKLIESQNKPLNQ